MSESSQIEDRQFRYVGAVTEGVRQVLLEQENAFLAGEDVGPAGSVWSIFRGLHDEFVGW